MFLEKYSFILTLPGKLFMPYLFHFCDFFIKVPLEQ